MNNLGRGNWFLMFGLFVVGMMVFVGAYPFWTPSAPESISYLNENESMVFTYNFSMNVSNQSDSSSSLNYVFGEEPSISSTLHGSQSSSFFNWISLNSSTGILAINATENNNTGRYNITLDVYYDGGSKSIGAQPFYYIINATNDAPAFTSSGIANNYSFSSTEAVQNFTLAASDEESHFPLVFDVVFNTTNCTHGANTVYINDNDCNLSAFGLTLTNSSNETAVISFAPNSSHVGTYWANISVMDAANNSACPHSWCDATYNTTNLTTYYSQMVKFTVYPSLSVNVSNCTGATLMEDVEFNCTVVITTPGETDSLALTSNASFRVGSTASDYNSTWFFLDDSSFAASNFNYNVTISVTPTKSEVGNLTINFTADNGDVAAVTESILIYVNYTESNVTLDSIGDMKVYENDTFSINATDEDLLILDSSVKIESLAFASNTSWVTYDSKINSGNYSTATFNVDWDYVINNLVEGNYSIMINVTDTALPTNNTHNQTFTIEILDENAPVWNSLSDPVALNLTEGTAFTYNVSMNVTDADVGDNITFYYQNVSASFCSLNATTFNSSGIISLTPVDCDVGEHNVSIIATDGKLNSTAKSFNFTVNNLADTPMINDLYFGSNSTTISNGSSRAIVSGVADVVTLKIDDDDFLIPSGQRSAFYNESLTIDVNATNSNGDEVELFNFSFAAISGVSDSRMIYNVSFTPSLSQVENYTVFVNITDVSGISINTTFYLNITESSNFPEIETIENKSVTIYDNLTFMVSASDYEDGYNELDLSYAISNITVAAPNLTISTTGVVTFDMDSNSSYAGIWQYNVTVTDSDTNVNSTTFWLYVYGNATLILPASGSLFNLTENTVEILNLTINHSVGNNLTYEFWIDSINCSFQNSSNCTYGNLTLRETTNSSGNASIYGWSFTPNYTDETYNNSKNLTVRVYPNTTAINSTQRDAVATNFSFKLNISHTNHAPEVYNSFGSHSGTYGTTSPITINLLSSIRDYDYSDSYYLQNVTFNITSDEGTSSQIYAEGTAGGNQLPWDGSIDSWSLQLYALVALEEAITIIVNDSISTDTSDPFSVTFTVPSTTPTPTPSGGSGSKTKLKHYSLKLIAPQDVIISELGFIDIPFVIQNNGQIDLQGISLNSFVRFNDAFSDDVKISLGDNYIEKLKFGESENFTMRIVANTQRAGKYKATILANVTSPKFSDFADFFIEIKKANESEAEQILIFTEKLVADNPECLELTELMNLAEEAFLLGEYSNSVRLAREVTDACEDAIESNEQIRYRVEGFVQDNFYYISFATLVVFFAGFVFYIYKRVRFNKSGMNEYV